VRSSVGRRCRAHAGLPFVPLSLGGNARCRRLSAGAARTVRSSVGRWCRAHAALLFVTFSLGGKSCVYEILPSQPTGYNPVGKPSTGFGTQRQSHNANSGITGREAHKNDGSNANATTIYSNTHDDPKAYSHIPSETRSRTCTIPTSWRYHGGTGTHRATVSGPGLW